MNRSEKTENLVSGEKSQKSSKSKFFSWKFLILILGLLLIIGVGIYFYYRYREDQYQKNLELGLKYLEEGDYEKAVLSFSDASSISDRHPEVFRLLATSSAASQDYGTAHEAYSKLIGISDDKVTPSILNAQIYAYEGNYNEANSILADLKKSNPDNEYVDYALNSIDSGNLVSNIENGGVIVYDFSGNIYFSSESGRSTDRVNRIYKSNVNNKKPEVIYESAGNNRIGGMSIWKNRLYFSDSNGLKSCDLDGKNETTIGSHGGFIYQNKIYSSQSEDYSLDIRQIGVFDLDGKLERNIDLRLNNEKCNDWIVYQGKIYYYTFTNDNSSARLYSLDLKSGEVVELVEYPLTGELHFVNGMYPWNDIIYISILDGDGYRYDSYNIKTGEQGKINFDQSAGFTANGKYGFFNIFGEMDEISIYDLESKQVVKTIPLQQYAGSDVGVRASGSMIALGDYLTPTFLFNNSSPIGRGQNTNYFQDIFRINLNDLEGELYFTNENS